MTSNPPMSTEQEIRKEIYNAYKGIISDEQIEATCEWWLALRRTELTELQEKIEKMGVISVRISNTETVVGLISKADTLALVSKLISNEDSV